MGFAYVEGKDKITQYLKIKDIVFRYSGKTFNRQNRCPCPLHNGNNSNFTVYPHTNSFYCFTCGVGGDVINFVSEYFNISYSEAICKLDEDYNLGIFERKRKTLNQLSKEAGKLKKKQDDIVRFDNWQIHNYTLLTNYFKWLMKQEKTAEIESDIEYIERLLDKHLNLKDNPLNLDARPLIRALYSKHRKR